MPDSKPNTVSLVVAGFFAIIVVGLVIWAFAIGNLTPDRREILRWGLPIASAIAAGSFTGGIRVTKSVLGHLGVAATGGFAVWLITFYVLFSHPPTEMSLTVYVDDDSGRPLKVDGVLSLHLRQIQSWPIEKGESLPRGIPSDWEGKSVPIYCDVDGYEQVNPTASYTLASDATFNISLQKKIGDTPPPSPPDNAPIPGPGRGFAYAGMMYLSAINDGSKNENRDVKEVKVPLGKVDTSYHQPDGTAFAGGQDTSGNIAKSPLTIGNIPAGLYIECQGTGDEGSPSKERRWAVLPPANEPLLSDDGTLRLSLYVDAGSGVADLSKKSEVSVYVWYKIK